MLVSRIRECLCWFHVELVDWGSTWSYVVNLNLHINAHVGGVNDLAFSHPNKQLCVITCGDDKTIKVFDAATGAKQYTFEGHDAPVYSVCPHYKENIQVTLLLLF